MKSFLFSVLIVIAAIALALIIAAAIVVASPFIGLLVASELWQDGKGGAS